ncbi:MAG: TIGR02266 family protein [Polyangiaceae bacterium]
MTQDTRKDRRVKIVSLNVRYKSATVDEFIENHAHDVSRGGIYIKTGTPFPAGTLLKFEIRLSSDQPLITGVGRVVWKRDNVQGDGEMPSGMGVKFIKVDDASKTVIDKLVNTHADAGKTYEAEIEAAGPGLHPPAGASEAASPPTASSLQKAKSSPEPVAPVRLGKATMLGIGVQSLPAGTSPPRPAVAPPRPSRDPGMFPQGVAKPAPDAATQEPTVMRQAAELLEEALREAGGSMAEIGTNPLFAGSPPAGEAPASPPDAPDDAKLPPTAADALTVHKMLSPLPAAPSPVPDGPRDAEAKARAMVAEMSPGVSGQKAMGTSDPPPTPSESKSGVRDSARPAPSIRADRTAPPAAVTQKSGGAAKWLLVGVLGAGAAVVFGVPSVHDAIFGAGETAVVAPPAVAPAPPASVPAEVPAVSAPVMPPAPSAIEVVEAGATASSAKPRTAAVAPSAPAPVHKTVTHPQPEGSVPSPKTSPPATSSVVEATPKHVAQAASPAPAKPAPAPAKPKAASDDNPY